MKTIKKLGALIIAFCLSFTLLQASSSYRFARTNTVLTPFYLNKNFNPELKSSQLKSENVKTEDRKTEAFGSISVSTGIKLYLIQGKIQKIKVEADDDVIADLKTEVSGGELRIFVDNKRNLRFHNSRELNVYITCPNLSQLETSSGSDVDVAGVWKAADKFTINTSSGSTVKMSLESKSLNIESSSGSSVDINIKASELELSSASGSSIMIKGKALSLKAETSSGANIKARDLKVETCVADASSASRITINVSKALEASASSVASVIYSGSPEKVDKSVSSLGKVRPE